MTEPNGQIQPQKKRPKKMVAIISINPRIKVEYKTPAATDVPSRFKGFISKKNLSQPETLSLSGEYRYWVEKTRYVNRTKKKVWDIVLATVSFRKTVVSLIF